MNNRKAEMSVIQFDQLPDLCLEKIFEFLNLRDLANCRAVNRLFKSYAEQAVDELKVTDDGAPCAELKGLPRGYYSSLGCLPDLTERPIDFENLISRKAFESTKSSPFNLDRLKFLHVHHFGNLDIEILNGFQKLVHLEIILPPVDTIATLILPNLKVLILRTIDRFHLSDRAYVLKTPQLEVLACGKINKIRVEFPETIKRLECDYQKENGLAKFKNLQVLNLRKVYGALNAVLSSDWSDLKELNLETIPHFSDHNVLLSSLADIMNQRAALQRKELKIYLDDVLLEDAAQLMQHAGKQDFQLKYYQLLRDDIHNSVYTVDFNELSTELTTGFFERFPAIRFLNATGPVDRERFEWFLKNATAVRELRLTDTSLDQAFMENLHSLNDRLTSLQVNGSSDFITNFDFILQFEHLTKFETDRQLQGLDLPRKAFQLLRKLKSFYFKKEAKRVEIERSYGSYSFCEVVPYPYGTSRFSRDNLQWEKLVDLYDKRERDRHNQIKCWLGDSDLD